MARANLDDRSDLGPTVNVLGIPLHAMTMAEVIEACRKAIVAGRKLSIGVVNAAKVVNMRRDPALRRSVLSSDLVVADGMSVVWAARLLGSPLPERVAGIDLFQELLKLADRQGYSIYLLGGRPDVVRDVVARVREAHPGARIVGYRDGYFDERDEAAVAAEIDAAHPDMLFVAISSPKKENFLARWGNRLDVRVCHGVGGSFDVLAGLIARAPLRWRELGLEWLHRLLQEPRRMWRRYFVTNTLFILMVLRAWARRIFQEVRPRR